MSGRRMELLAPAQGPEQLEMAMHFGADAVYLAAPRWGMRAGARNFTLEELEDGVARAHGGGVAVHLTLNTVMRDEDIDDLPAFLERIDSFGVDAVIVADLGAMSLVRTHAPHVALHVSTQASVMSAAAAREYARLGARRIVLAREMSLAQIAEMRRRLPDEVELEVFAHGSLCMAYSGRCLLSAELMGPGRSASRGSCAQPCRWAWRIVEERSGALVEVESAPDASYLLSSNDLCLLEHVDELAEAGVDALKIEGRSKGSYYTACVTNAYRHVLDGEPAGEWVGELDMVSHRPYSTGFLFGEPMQNPGRVDYVRERVMVAVVLGCERRAGRWVARVECRNRAREGELLTVLSPGHAVRELRLCGSSLVRNGEVMELEVPFELSAHDLLCKAAD